MATHAEPGGSVFAFDRFSADERLIVVLNRSDEPRAFTTDRGGARWADAITGETMAAGGGSVTLPPHGFLFLLAES